MTTEIRFYHLTRKTLEQALPEMLEKTVERGWRAVVMAGSAERVEALTQMLWTYSPNGFLPHGNAKDGHAEEQPIWLTERDERPNNAEILFLVDGASCAAPQAYQRVCELFDGNDESAVANARRHWRDYVVQAKAETKIETETETETETGAEAAPNAPPQAYALSYWQQTAKGWTDATPQPPAKNEG